MTEAVFAARPQAGPAEKFEAFLARGDDGIVEAENLTFDMIDVTARWFKLNDPRNANGWMQEHVRKWWLHQFVKAGRKEDAQEFGEVWEDTFTKARPQADFAENLNAAIAKHEAKAQPEPEEAEPEPEAKEEPEAEEPKADPEATYVEDEGNGANDVRRRMWRLSGALQYIEPAEVRRPEVVGALIWRISEGSAVGRQAFVDWVGGEAEGGALWAKGFAGVKGWRAEDVYHLAQARGWRYPIAQNLNKLEEMVERTEAALVRGNAEIYQSGDSLVRPVRQEVDATKGRKTSVAVLVRIDHAFLKTQLTGHVDFFKWDKKDQREGIGPSADVVNGVLDRYGKWKFPVATGIVTAPTLRRDGSVLTQEGWDPATGLIVMGPLPPMPKLSLKPSREDAEHAARILDGDLLGEFPFCDEPSKAAALSGLITPNVRAALTCVPMHNTTAPAPGTGKSFLWDVAGAIAAGDAMPIAAAGKDIEEMEKRLNTKIFQGLTLFSLDNVSIPIGGDALCQMIERPTYASEYWA
jgi:hypothetical protein